MAAEHRRGLRPHVVLIGAGYALGAALIQQLPELPPSFGASPDDRLWLGRGLAAFLLPTAAATIQVLLRSVVSRHPQPSASSAAALAVHDAIVLWIVAFLTAVHATVLLGLVGVFAGRTWAARIVPALLGLTLIGIGNLLPRTRPNLAIGIRTATALADRALWMHVHRVAGYVLVFLGGVILLAGLAGPAPAGPRMARLIEPAAVLGIPALVAYSRRLVRLTPSDQ
jgi:hypothetical protein